MTATEKNRKIAQGIRVLRRQELEEYLYDSEVLRTYIHTEGCEKNVMAKVLDERESLLNRQAGPGNVKDVSRDLLKKIREITGLSNLGNKREGFASQYLVPAPRTTPEVYGELRDDVFSSSRRRMVRPQGHACGRITMTGFRDGGGRTVMIGNVNRNDQEARGHRGKAGTDQNQLAHQMKGRCCGLVYGTNGSDVFQRKCPERQGGAAGIAL